MRKKTDAKEMLGHARTLRRQASDAEMVLWKQLRARRMKGYKFRRQVVIGQYIVDFVCLQAGLIIEADGGQHVKQKRYDNRRTQFLESRGFTVLRFWNHEIFVNFKSVLEQIEYVLNHTPHPNPLPRGRGGR